MKIYKDHKRLYYNAIDKSWVQDGASDTQAGDLSSSEFSSIDDIDLVTSENDNIATREGENPESDESDFQWEEPTQAEQTDQG